MRIGNSSMKSLLYSVSNCITVVRSNRNHTPGLLPGLGPSVPLPLGLRSPLTQVLISAHDRPTDCQTGPMSNGWMEVTIPMTSAAPNSVWRMCPGVPSFPDLGPQVQAQLLLVCAVLSGMEHPGSPDCQAGLRPLEWPGNSVLLLKQAFAAFGFPLCICSEQLLKSFSRPGFKCASQATGAVLGGMFHQKPHSGSEGPGSRGLEGPAYLWVLGVCET